MFKGRGGAGRAQRAPLNTGWILEPTGWDSLFITISVAIEHTDARHASPTTNKGRCSFPVAGTAKIGCHTRSRAAGLSPLSRKLAVCFLCSETDHPTCLPCTQFDRLGLAVIPSPECQTQTMAQYGPRRTRTITSTIRICMMLVLLLLLV